MGNLFKKVNEKHSSLERPNVKLLQLISHSLQDVTQTTGNKYFQSFVQLRHNLMHNKTHVVSLGHITHSPKDYQAIGITLNLATRLYMRHLVRAKVIS